MNTQRLEALAGKENLTEDEVKELEALNKEAAQIAVKAEARKNAAALKAEADAKAAEEKEADEQRVKAFVEEAVKKQADADAAKANRLPLGESKAPVQAKFGHLSKYDSKSPEDMAFAAEMLYAAKRKGGDGPSNALLQAIAIKAVEDKGEMGLAARAALKSIGMDPEQMSAVKANELNYSTQSSYGDEFVPTVYGTSLWLNVRADTFLLDAMPAKEFTGPGDTFPIPLESGDPTWYRVGQATDLNGTTGRPDATIGDSKLGTDKKDMTLGKVAARVGYTGEMDEDSIIQWAPNLRRQLEVSYREQMEHLLIDGDTATGGTTNINHIGGTPTSTGTKQDLFLTFNGLRKLGLVTNTANSRSAGGSLADSDFLETAWLMGTAGKNAQPTAAFFVVDPNVAKKAAQLAAVKTRDVFTNATIENGLLAGIWAYKVYTSWFMHYKSTALLANTAGKVDQTTPANNTRGAILCVRPDQWLVGYKRRINFKMQEIPDSDSYQMIATARIGLVSRDSEASAITYNVGV